MTNYSFGNEPSDRFDEAPSYGNSGAYVQGEGFDPPSRNVPEQKPQAKTLFDAFKEEMNHPAIEGDEVRAFIVENREGISVEYSVILDFDILQRYLDRHTKKQKVNALNLAYDILTLLNRGFRMKGERIEVDGEPLTFVSHEFLSMVEKSSSRDAIHWIYGTDAQILATMASVLDACGYSDVVAREDLEDPNPSRRG